MRHTLVLVTALICAALPPICAADAAGKPHWSRVDFTESTHLGPMRVVISTTGKPDERRIDRIRIWAKGRELRVPGGEALRIANPHLHEVDLSYTASYVCWDGCPDISRWPVTLIIPFGDEIRWPEGERPANNACEQSWLSIDALVDRITEVTLWDCSTGIAEDRTIFEEKTK